MYSMKPLFYLFMVLTLAFDVLGDYAAKRWSLAPTNLMMAFVITAYAISGILWAISLKYGFLSKGTVLINVLNVMLMVGIGVAVFKESLTATNAIGIALGLLSIYLISL